MSSEERAPLPVSEHRTSTTSSIHVPKATHKSKLSSTLVLAAVGALVGSSFQFGYNNSVINTPAVSIKKWINSTHEASSDENDHSVVFIFSVVVSIWAIGGLIGSLSAGFFADKLGRRGAMMANNVFAIAAAVLVGLAKPTQSVVPLALGRLVSGINCGANTVLPTMYLSEIAPIHLRGAFGVLHQLCVVTGILLSQVVGLPSLFGNSSLWPLALCMTALPAIIQPFLLLFATESPRYLLITRQDAAAATRSLKRLRNVEDDEDETIREELRQMEEEAARERSEPSVGCVGIITSSVLRQPLAIAIVLHLSQQLCGINAIFYYSTELFKSVGLSPEDSVYASIGTSGLLVVSTLISVPLMERAGRRLLMLLGLGLVIVFEIVLTISLSLGEEASFVNSTSTPSIATPAAAAASTLAPTPAAASQYVGVIAIVATVAAFAIGPGSIPWFFPAEIFPQSARGVAMSIGCAVNWLANFVVGISFEHLQKATGSLCLLPFIVISIFCWIFTFVKMPETMKKTFAEIYALFGGKITDSRD